MAGEQREGRGEVKFEREARPLRSGMGGMIYPSSKIYTANEEAIVVI